MKKVLLIGLSILSISVFSQSDMLRKQIQQILYNKNVKIGLAINGLENGDTLSINGTDLFPMFSVVKFPTALTVLHLVDEQKLSLDSSPHFVKSTLDPSTFSPLRDEINKTEFDLTIRDLLSYAISRSDNIAFEKLVELAGGINMVNDYTKLLQKNILIQATGKEGLTAYSKNTSTPLAMNQLLIQAYQEKILSKNSYDLLWKMMLETPTGLNRLKGLLPIGTKVAHKTGTSGADENGLNIAFNDVGIVTLPNGKHFAISVFITDSKENDEINAAIIAEITKATWDYFVAKN